MLQPERQQARSGQDLIYRVDFGCHGLVLRPCACSLAIPNEYKARAKRQGCLRGCQLNLSCKSISAVDDR
jgi:hypothetical protein